MSSFPRIPLAALTLVVLLQGCKEEQVQSPPIAIDARPYLPAGDGSGWEDESAHTGEVRIGPDSAIPVEWRTVRQSSHLAVSGVTLRIPPHPRSQRYEASLKPDRNDRISWSDRGAAGARVLALPLYLKWTHSDGEENRVFYLGADGRVYE
jgi:hypothetical protein